MVQVFEYDIDPGPMVSPATGALVNRDDNDELLMAFKDAEDLEKDLRRFKAQIRDTLWSRTVDGGTKTRHIEGRKVSATLVEQDPSPNTTVLKQILRSFPDAAKNVIVPSGYRVDKTQWKKCRRPHPNATILTRSKTWWSKPSIQAAHHPHESPNYLFNK